MTEETATEARAVLDGVGERVGVDLRWWVPDCGDRVGTAAVEDWVEHLAATSLVTGQGARGLGLDVARVAGSLAAADRALAGRLPQQRSGSARPV
jgi:hypothetical protein